MCRVVSWPRAADRSQVGSIERPARADAHHEASLGLLTPAEYLALAPGRVANGRDWPSTLPGDGSCHAAARRHFAASSAPHPDRAVNPATIRRGRP